MTGPARPIVVQLERPDAVEPVARRLRDEGWSVHTGWDVPAAPWDLAGERVLGAGTVTDLASAQAALRVLQRSAGIVVAVDVDAALRRPFLADLHALGEVRTETARVAVVALPISAEQRQLLQLVADGASVPEAAEALFLSRRTAERRLALTRTALGVRSTTEAIARLVGSQAAG